MLQIEINNQIVVLDNKSVLNLKIYNPLFNDMGTFSYPISAPLEPNRAIFEHLDQIDNIKKQSLTFKMWLNGDFFMEGDVVITNTVDRFEFYLKSGKSAIANTLKNSYLDESINGASWGENPDGITTINASAGKIYPESNFTVAPVAGSNEVFNQWDVTKNQLKGYSTDALSILDLTLHFSPMVYVAYLINKIINGLGYSKVRDDSDDIPDFKRISIFSPRKKPYATIIGSIDIPFYYTGPIYDITTFALQYKHWLPHVTISEFIKDLKDRFNIALYWDTLLYNAEVIHLDKILNEAGDDISHLLVKYDEVPVLSNVGLTFTNPGSDKEIYSTPEVYANYSILPVNSVTDAMLQVKGHKEESFIGFKTPDNRLWTSKIEDYNDSSTSEFFLRNKGITETKTDSDSGNIYEYSALGTTADVVLKSFKVEMYSGRLINHIYFKNIVIKATAAATLKIKLYINHVRDGGTQGGTITTSEGLGSVNVPITNDDFFGDPVQNMWGDWVTLPIYKDITFLISRSSRELGSADYLTIDFCISNSPGITMTMAVDDRPDDNVFVLPSVFFDSNISELVEINPLATYIAGNTDYDSEITEISPGGKIPYMVKKWMDYYKFQMPYVDIDLAEKPTDFAYMMTRGFINDEFSQSKYAPFACHDVVDIYGAEYTSRLTVNQSPQMSLRWEAEKGLVNSCFKNTVPWHLLYRRPLKGVFQFSQRDLQRKLYKPISIKNQTCIISSISVAIDIYGNIKPSTVEMFTK